MASPPTWKSVALSELEGVKPPQGAMSSLFMLSPSGGGVLTTKCADACDINARLMRDMDLNEATIIAAAKSSFLFGS